MNDDDNLGNLGRAVAHTVEGGAIHRAGWERGRFVWLHQHVDLGRFFVQRTANGTHSVWTASHDDLLATDWRKIDYPYERTDLNQPRGLPARAKD